MSSGLGEFGRIRQFFAPLAADAPGALGLGDDAALLGSDRVITADAMVEGVHFLPGDLPELVARKLLRVNLSDLAAMAATPEAYLLAMALPERCDDGWVERFAAGLAADQSEFGIDLLGGDSVATPGPITLSVTAIGRLDGGRAATRGAARPEDLVLVSGTIGDGALGLLVATGRLPGLPMPAAEHLRDRYQLPRPRVALGRRLGSLVHAMMDVSDGLVGDLEHICAASGVGASIEAGRVPLSEAAAEAVSDDFSLLATVLTGGDDYELLFTAPAGALSAITEAAAAASTPVSVIGRITAGAGVRVTDRDGAELPLARSGYRHA